MAYLFQPNLSGLFLQAMGALLLAALAALLLRTVNRSPVRIWSFGWLTLGVALTGLWLSLFFGRFELVGRTVYLLGEYVFGYLVFAGCRAYARGQAPRREEAWLLVPAAGVAIGLAQVASVNENVSFAIHSLIFPFLFYLSLSVLREARGGRTPVSGLRVLKIALLLLTMNYLHYAPFFAAASVQNPTVLDPYLTYAPLYDLIFQIMLMFGMTMAVTGRVQLELEAANAELEVARDRLEWMSRSDALTSTLNRHAFAEIAEARRCGRGALRRGAAVVVDLDGLKQINDRYGHTAGDLAVQTVAGVLHSILQPDDLLFRWGGDEFVLLLSDVSEAHARRRMATLNASLQRTWLADAPVPVDLTASCGIAAFDDAMSLEVAIAAADAAMYRRKTMAPPLSAPVGPRVQRASSGAR